MDVSAHYLQKLMVLVTQISAEIVNSPFPSYLLNKGYNLYIQDVSRRLLLTSIWFD